MNTAPVLSLQVYWNFRPWWTKKHSQWNGKHLFHSQNCSSSDKGLESILGLVRFKVRFQSSLKGNFGLWKQVSGYAVKNVIYQVKTFWFVLELCMHHLGINAPSDLMSKVTRKRKLELNKGFQNGSCESQFPNVHQGHKTQVPYLHVNNYLSTNYPQHNLFSSGDIMTTMYSETRDDPQLTKLFRFYNTLWSNNFFCYWTKCIYRNIHKSTIIFYPLF